VIGVDVTGTLQAVEQDTIGPPQLENLWQFKIAHLAPEGSTVEAGTPVVTFDASELEQRLLQERAERDAALKRLEKEEKALELARQQDALQLEEARGRLGKAALKVDVPETLLRGQELAEARLDLELAELEVAYLEARQESARRSAAATLDALRSQHSRADRLVRRTEEHIAQMVRPAPRAGTVIHPINWRGEKKKVGDACWRGESVIELPDLSRMKAQGQVHEADAGRVFAGQPVRFRLDAHPEVDIAGVVGSIWRIVQRESWSSKLRVVRLDIELSETDTQRMRPGMRFRGLVETERVESALLVPADAVFLEDEGPVVYRRTWTGHEAVRVELGRRNDDQVEVRSGLAEGDRVSRVDLAPRERGA
jgi:multidrug efflux pump subunit AcrA (membrane-fusion protein)